MRRFSAGMGGEIGGIHWRVVQGKKSPNDLRLELYSPRFVPPKMDLSFLFADFYADNERVLVDEGYIRLSRAAGKNAGHRYLTSIEGAMYVGWESAAEQLHEDRRQKTQIRLLGSVA